jgi:signal transduction histidine kinase
VIVHWLLKSAKIRRLEHRSVLPVLLLVSLLASAPLSPARAQTRGTIVTVLVDAVVPATLLLPGESERSAGSAGLNTTSTPSKVTTSTAPCTDSNAGAQDNRGSARIPLYESWYFYLALLFVGITLPASLFRRRMMLMKGRIGIVLEERSRIARECHDTLMAGFAAISWQLEATAKIFRDNNLNSTPAAESCELARNMVAHCQAEARRIIWDLRETDEITSILSQALARSLAANHRSGAVETRLEVEGEEIPLAPGCVHHLVCIGQEAVTNAIRHAQPSQVLVHVRYERATLSLSVRDDGRGYESERGPSRYGHFGIAVMEERARKLGGSFRIQELSGSGTEVMVKVPFNAVQQPDAQGAHVIRWIGI